MTDLGVNSEILRRDYLYGSLLSEGTVASEVSPRALLQQRSQKFVPYIVAHDFQRTGEIVAVDGPAAAAAEYNGEVFEVVVVGAGLSGLAAAYYVQRDQQGHSQVLILENHDTFGGNSRRDEFNVKGTPLYAPQASTVIQDLPPALAPSDEAASLFRDLGVDLLRIRVPEDQYFFGVFRDDRSVPAPTWFPNIFAVPLPEDTKRDLGAFVDTVVHFYDEGDWRKKLAELDKIKFRDYLQQRGWTDELFQVMVPELGAFFGFPDEVSAACVYAHYGSQGPRYIYGFTGGNSGLARHLVKALIPGAINGDSSPDGILNGAIDARALDRPGNATRLRVASTAVRVEHEGHADNALHVSVTIASRGRRYRVRARGVIMACGGFVARRIVADMPAEQRHAYDRFVYAPVLWANVALNNSRALDRAGLNFLSTYLNGFGGLLLRYEKMGAVGCSDSERPNVIGVGCPRFYPGLTAREQEDRAQLELMETPFVEYEKRIYEDLARVLGPWGFDPKRDIAAMAIHRWAQHSYVFGYPGFFTGGMVERARVPFGRIAFAHTDLHKFSLAMGAVEQGHRAAMEIAGRLNRRGAGAVY